MNKRKRLLVLYDWFYPGFRAGGPIQSLTNLAASLMHEYDIHVITGASDLNSKVIYKGIHVNVWNDVIVPGRSGSIKVFYAASKALNKNSFEILFKEVKPDIVYLNGIFSYKFFLLPLLAIRTQKEDFKVIICPRGMLKGGALEGKSLKKKIYLRAIRLSGLLNEVCWHATTNEEANDIEKHFPISQGIFIAPNISKSPCSDITLIHKKKGEVKLVYLSLINEHKNLLGLLQLLHDNINPDISLDIYGPVVDEGYWKRCQLLMAQMQGRVKYNGDVQPDRVQEVIANYHAVILLTKGENFGHALYEGLSVGRPVITSCFTPWQDLYRLKAGTNVDISDTEDCNKKLNQFANMEKEQYEIFCKGAYSMATNYYVNVNADEKYNRLFQLQ